MPIIERFIEKIEFIPFHACWEWIGTKNDKGYGKFLVNREIGEIRAHRASLLLLNGIDAGALYVCHKCYNPGCVRPDHLFIGTPKENMVDKENKGRGRGHFRRGQLDPRSGAGKWLAQKTHCLRGHEFTEENTLRKDGRRICKLCVVFRGKRNRKLGRERFNLRRAKWRQMRRDKGLVAS